MASFPKQIAALALAAAAGCSDSFPPALGPLDRFYYPVGMAVRRLPAGNTALLVVSSNFDLRYDYDVGGAVLAVDPDLSGDARPVVEGGQGDPTLAVLGGLNIGSFGGEIDYLDNTCDSLSKANPAIAAGGAKVLVASRSKQLVYAIDMDPQGGLRCDGCEVAVPVQALDPYDVAAVCAPAGSGTVARAYVTHLRAPDNEGLLTELDLLGGGSSTLDLGLGSTFSATFDPVSSQLFVTSRVGTIDFEPIRWFNPLTTTASAAPVLQGHNIAADVHGVLGRQFAIFRNAAGTPTGYLRLDLFDYDLAASTGTFITTGGALAVYDLTPNALGEPTMQLIRVVPTCNGSGQLRVLPRAGSRALLAMTCDSDGTLLFYDDELGAMVGRIGLDAVTGKPVLGSRPYGLAVEQRDTGPCLNGSASCTRLYVGSFDYHWVSLVELDVTNPTGASIVKRIGGTP